MPLRRWAASALGLLCSSSSPSSSAARFESRRLPDLEVWHRLVPADEVRAADVTAGLHSGGLPRAGRPRVFGSGPRRGADSASRNASVPNRYVAGSVSSPVAAGLRRQPHLRTRSGADSWRRAAHSRSHRLAVQPSRRRGPAGLAGHLRARAPNARPRHGAGGLDRGDLGRLDGRRARRDAPRASARWRRHADLPGRLLQWRGAGGEVLARRAARCRTCRRPTGSCCCRR